MTRATPSAIPSSSITDGTMAVDGSSPPSPDAAARPVAGDRRLLWQVLSWALVGGAAFSLAGIVAVDEQRRETLVSLLISGFCLTAAVALRPAPDRLPLGFAHVTLLGATAAISVEIHYDVRPAHDDEIFYLWIALFVFYFLPRRAALLHMGAVGIGYWLAIFAGGSGEPEDRLRWLVTLSTLTAAGLLIHHLARRQDAMIARLNEAVRSDPLTGVLNRKGFADAFVVQLAMAERRGTPFALLIGDLDGFKLVNDRLGHAVGDRTLKTLATVLQQSVRGQDRPARIGGEEFAVLVDDADEARGLQAAERLRVRVQDAFAGSSVPVTISIGVAIHPRDGTGSDTLMGCADRALYEAKARGRNRSVLCRGDG